MKKRIVAVLLAGMCIWGFCGCQESDSVMVRRARLVANENLKLQKQLEEKERQIEQLKKETETLKNEREQAIASCGEVHLKLLEMVSESEKRNETLTVENEQLKEELAKYKPAQP
ncbi:MAG TPA: hypothetical protein PK052_12930 [Anaerohalosphaeraceae bacterium]|nr:hypothetical protein [Phycisphaerae bacterium]HOK95465.1 hypothetical protein [Anaerohalosphaeraceae bacterium]HOL32871.1 hypothetical protein [Anaerohalosphaeraceae bacterium]HOM76639.1 hypothetical protein [Anaerohalosphaeraceae bacterium]HPC63678.1 hypothetical protein [Anaerohalosphaeraceae bacterium]